MANSTTMMQGATAEAGGHLGEQGEDSDAGVAAHNGHVHILERQALGLGHKGVGAHDVQRCHAQHLARVVHSGFLHHLSGDGHRGIDWVGDYGHHCLHQESQPHSAHVLEHLRCTQLLQMCRK